MVLLLLRQKIFLSKPKAWYVISHRRGCNQFATRTVCHQSEGFVCFLLRLDYIRNFRCNYIHGFAVIFDYFEFIFTYIVFICCNTPSFMLKYKQNFGCIALQIQCAVFGITQHLKGRKTNDIPRNTKRI